MQNIKTLAELKEEAYAKLRPTLTTNKKIDKEGLKDQSLVWQIEEAYRRETMLDLDHEQDVLESRANVLENNRKELEALLKKNREEYYNNHDDVKDVMNRISRQREERIKVWNNFFDDLKAERKRQKKG